MAIRISGMTSGLDTEAIVSAMVSGYKAKKDKLVKAQTKLSWKQDAYKAANTKVYNLYTSISSLRYTSAYALKKTTVSDISKATVSASSNAVNGTQKLKVNKLAQAGYLTGGQLDEGVTGSTKLSELKTGTAGAESDPVYGEKTGTIKVKATSTGEEKTITVNQDTTIDSFIQQLNDAGIKASYDANNRRIFISSKDSGAANDFTLEGTDDNGDDALTALGLVEGAGRGKTAKRLTGEDAEIELNGAKFTSTSNNFSVNGLAITATGITATGEEISITTATDVDGIYDKIKDFLTQYNEVVNYLQTQYNADSAKGYEPLTDEEKSEMTDKQVEKWEQKVKDALLRRDSTIGNIMNVMSTSMAKSYEINGKSYSLSNFGINTLGYLYASANERNAYHIDGDADDSYTSANKDKLKAAIAEDPDTVIELLKDVTDGLYKSLDKQMKSSSLRSAYTIYNDKEMKSEYSDYTKTIKTWETRIADMENRYYKQFAAMEKALSNMQANSSSLSGLLGQ